MDYSFDNEARMLDDSVSRFVADHAGKKQDLWPLMADLGWLALPFSEEAGGVGLGAVGAMVLMERFGAGLLSTPYIPSVVMAGAALARSPNGADRLSFLIEGRSRPAVACTWERDGARASARADGGNLVLTGSGLLVLGDDDADAVIVPAWTDGAAEPDLFLVPAGKDGVVFTSRALFDGGAARHMELKDVSVPSSCRLNARGEGGALLHAMQDAALLAAAAENLGAMQALFDLTLDYAKTRRQFGRAIGSFQTIQFRLVDLWIRLDEARSLLITATMAADEGHAEARKLTAAAWIQTLWSGRAISEEAIQIHGAIGMTEEYAVGRYVKRILVNELMFGPAEPHLERYASA